MDKFTSFGIIVDRYGKEHKIYPAKLKWKDEIRRLTPKFSDNAIILNILYPARDEDGKVIIEDDMVQYSDEAYDAMMEILMMAFDYKYTREQIEDFIDIGIAPKVFEIFYGLSGLKKKMTE